MECFPGKINGSNSLVSMSIPLDDDNEYVLDSDCDSDEQSDSDNFIISRRLVGSKRSGDDAAVIRNLKIRGGSSVMDRKESKFVGLKPSK